MGMIVIEDYERRFIDRMRNNGVSFEVAAVCTLMYFHEISRPTTDIPLIFSRYFAQLTEDKVSETFDFLVKEGLIEIVQRGELYVYKPVNGFEERLEEYTGISNLANDLKAQRKTMSLSSFKNSKVNLTPLGVVSAKGNYQSLLTRLYSASNTIKAAMLCSKVYEDTADVLEAMAEQGVQIRLLIGSDDVVKKVRGKTVNGTYDDWAERFKGIPEIEIREFNNVSATELCSSYLIDDSVLRYVVYDGTKIRSLDGFLLEVVQEPSTNINLVKWYRDKFDMEWENAKYSSRPLALRVLTSKITICIVASALLSLWVILWKPEGLLFELLVMLIGAILSYVVQKSFIAIRDYCKRISVAMKNREG